MNTPENTEQAPIELRDPQTASSAAPDSEQPTHVPELAATLGVEPGDRRRHRRFVVQRPGKVFRRSTQQYVPVVSEDVSFGGARLRIESARPFVAGELLDVGLAMSSRAIVPSASLLRAVVVRSERVDEALQAVAVRYLYRATAAA